MLAVLQLLMPFKNSEWILIWLLLVRSLLQPKYSLIHSEVLAEQFRSIDLEEHNLTILHQRIVKIRSCYLLHEPSFSLKWLKNIINLLQGHVLRYYIEVINIYLSQHQSNNQLIQYFMDTLRYRRVHDEKALVLIAINRFYNADQFPCVWVRDFEFLFGEISLIWLCFDLNEIRLL